MSGLAQVTSPPYDVIATDYETRLMAADPHNVVRLILPLRARGETADPYQDAAADLARWLAEGILTADPAPALYVYEQADASLVIQRGLIGALGLVPYAAGVVRPHENVMPGPVAGRRQLMEATQANLEPIFLLYQGENGAATRLVNAVADGHVPLAEAVTSDGLRHRLWAVTDPAELAAIAADLAPRTALIADGHHRYAAYLELQRQLRQSGAGPGPWDGGLALLVDSTAYPPRVGAIHRVVDGLVPETAARLAGSAFAVRELAGGTGDVPGALAELDRACGCGMAFLVAGHGQDLAAHRPGPGSAAHGHVRRAGRALAAAGRRCDGRSAVRAAVGDPGRRAQRPGVPRRRRGNPGNRRRDRWQQHHGALLPHVGGSGVPGGRARPSGTAQIDVFRSEAAHGHGHASVRSGLNMALCASVMAHIGAKPLGHIGNFAALLWAALAPSRPTSSSLDSP